MRQRTARPLSQQGSKNHSAGTMQRCRFATACRNEGLLAAVSLRAL